MEILEIVKHYESLFHLADEKWLQNCEEGHDINVNCNCLDIFELTFLLIKPEQLDTCDLKIGTLYPFYLQSQGSNDPCRVEKAVALSDDGVFVDHCMNYSYFPYLKHSISDYYSDTPEENLFSQIMLLYLANVQNDRSAVVAFFLAKHPDYFVRYVDYVSGHITELGTSLREHLQLIGRVLGCLAGKDLFPNCVLSKEISSVILHDSFCQSHEWYPRELYGFISYFTPLFEKYIATPCESRLFESETIVPSIGVCSNIIINKLNQCFSNLTSQQGNDCYLVMVSCYEYIIRILNQLHIQTNTSILCDLKKLCGTIEAHKEPNSLSSQHSNYHE